MAAGVRIMWPQLVSVHESEGEIRAKAGSLAKKKNQNSNEDSGGHQCHRCSLIGDKEYDLR